MWRKFGSFAVERAFRLASRLSPEIGFAFRCIRSGMQNQKSEAHPNAALKACPERSRRAPLYSDTPNPEALLAPAAPTASGRTTAAPAISPATPAIAAAAKSAGMLVIGEALALRIATRAVLSFLIQVAIR